MAAALSVDLRERVLLAVDSGEKIAPVARRFGVTRPTIYSWLALREETGSLQRDRPINRQHHRHDQGHRRPLIDSHGKETRERGIDRLDRLHKELLSGSVVSLVEVAGAETEDLSVDLRPERLGHSLGQSRRAVTHPIETRSPDDRQTHQHQHQ